MAEVSRALQDDDPQDELPLGPGRLDLAPGTVQGSTDNEDGEVDETARPSDEEPTE